MCGGCIFSQNRKRSYKANQNGLNQIVTRFLLCGILLLKYLMIYSICIAKCEYNYFIAFGRVNDETVDLLKSYQLFTSCIAHVQHPELERKSGSSSRRRDCVCDTDGGRKISLRVRSNRIRIVYIHRFGINNFVYDFVS